MGDSGSLALGGLIAGLSILSKTELLTVVIAGLAVVEMLSVVLQIAVYKTRKIRIFKMAPFHHHIRGSGGWNRDHRHGAVLAARRDVRGASARPCSTRIGWPRPVAEFAPDRAPSVAAEAPSVTLVRPVFRHAPNVPRMAPAGPDHEVMVEVRGSRIENGGDDDRSAPSNAREQSS